MAQVALTILLIVSALMAFAPLFIGEGVDQ